MDVGNPYRRDGLLRRALPFLLAIAVLPYALLLVPQDARDTSLVLVAAGASAAIVLAVPLLPWDDLPSAVQVVPPLAFLVVVALLRHADGGHESGYGPLAMVSVLWLAMFATRTMLYVGIAGVAALFAVPMLTFGDPLYPAGEWRRAIAWTAVSALVGVVVQRLVEQRTRSLQYRDVNLAVSRVLFESRDLDDAIPALLEAIGSGLGWQYGIYWKPDQDARRLHRGGTWYDTACDVSELEADTQERVFDVDEGLIGSVWRDGDPRWVCDLADEPGLVRGEIVLRAGMRSGVFVPVPTGSHEQRDGLIEFLSTHTRKPDERMTESLRLTAGYIYQFIRRKEAEQRLQSLRALDINDNVVQDLVAAKLAIEAGDPEILHQAVDRALAEGKRIISELAQHAGSYRRVTGETEALDALSRRDTT